GANIADATDSSYSRNNLQSSDAGNYSVVVSNVAGSVTSSDAALTVNVPPAITGQPQSLTVNQGGTASFSVTATGTTPLSYRWRFKGVAISGATGTSYTRANAQFVHAGAYSVVVANAAGNVTSPDATLTVFGSGVDVFRIDGSALLQSGGSFVCKVTDADGSP